MMTKMIVDLYSPEQILELITANGSVAYFFYRTFDQITQNLVMRYYVNSPPSQTLFEFKLPSNDPKLYHIYYEEDDRVNKPKRMAMHNAIQTLEHLQVLKKKGMNTFLQFNFHNYQFNRSFFDKAMEFKQKIPKFKKASAYLQPYKVQQFDLMQLLESDSEVATHSKINNVSKGVTREMLQFVRSPLQDKLYFLIRNFISHSINQKNMKGQQKSNLFINLLLILLMQPRSVYKQFDKIRDLLTGLQKIKLVKKLPNDGFIISDDLHKFVFKQSQPPNFNCQVIVQINFTIYIYSPTRIPSTIRRIFGHLLQIQNESMDCESFMVGRITKDRCIRLFRRNIRAVDILDFLNSFVKRDCRQDFGVGKWSKIPYLKVQNSKYMIPSYIQKQIGIWENKLIYGNKQTARIPGVDDAEIQQILNEQSQTEYKLSNYQCSFD